MVIIGYAFLLFQEESSVQALIDACIEEDGKLYLCVSSPTIKDKPVSNTTDSKLQLQVFQNCYEIIVTGGKKLNHHVKNSVF